MSTRCAMMVETPDGEVMRAYRHCDGYPEVMGLTIANALMDAKRLAMNNGTRISQMAICELMGMPCNLEVEPHDAWHGDIEYLYVIRLDDRSGDAAMAIYEPEWDEPYEHVMRGEPLFDGTPTEFVGGHI